MCTGEQKVTGLALIGVFTYALKNAKAIATRRDKLIEEHKRKHGEDTPQRVPSGNVAFVDHPLVSWFLINAGPIGVSLFVNKLSEKLSKVKGLHESFSGQFLKSFITNLALTETIIAYNWLLIHYVYSHIPFFDKKRTDQDVWESVKDYAVCNGPVTILTSLLDLAARNHIDTPKPGQRFRPLLFLFKLAWCRAVTDLFFWIGHYMIHKREHYWVHKKHHEHNKTKIWTNYHFSIPDLIIEASIPLTLAVTSVKLFGLSFNRFELYLIATYVGGLEVTSHVGKAVPVMSIFPPFSPLLTYYDDWNVWFHETHHNLLRCNYSITPYWDCLFGTAKFV
uniref:Fatty acid hydroxylase domain-containing protein n=1 Tax=Aplanochytrium stocchinoi TaxID=215587 RepID=A0A7S3LPZ0_9STRA